MVEGVWFVFVVCGVKVFEVIVKEFCDVGYEVEVVFFDVG